jgi:hypothetical protein
MTTKINTSQIADGAITAAKINSSVQLGGPTITAIGYPGDDTAADPAGGQTITLTGTGFKTGPSVIINGVASGTATISSNLGTTWVSRIGSNYSSGYDYYGYISDLRVIKSAAQYSSSFVPPSSPLTAVKNTVLLNNMTSAGIYDSAMITEYETLGDAKISTAVKKYGNSSMYFDGTGDYLNSQGSNFPGNFSTGDFTIEAWIYWNSLASESAIFYGSGVGWVLYVYPANRLQWGRASPLTGVNLLTGSTTLATGQWYHIAVTRSSGTVKLWVNGTLDGSVSDTQDYTGSGNLQVGRSHSSQYFNGYMDDFRITRGYARYTGNFTPTTTPFIGK